MKNITPTPFLTTITGNNFSGRSNFLKSLINPSDANKPSFLYIGEQPSNFISGIFPTVKNEIDLHSTNTPKEILNAVKDLLSKYNFGRLSDKNPFTLSGGEQTILVILSSLLLYPEKLAIDTTLEQLHEEWRLPLLSAIQEGMFPSSNIFLADNRLREYNLYNNSADIPVTQEAHRYKFEVPSINYAAKDMRNSKSIELKDLSFAYDESELLLDKINLRLEPGHIYHLIGQNGAGKTTLAKLLTGILKLKSGKLLVEEREYNAYNYPGQLTGYSFQNPDEQLFSSSIEDEILIPLKRESLEYSKIRDTYLEMFGLQNVKKYHPAELPFVMRKRISLAATLASQRPWYILDEPTLGQDDSFVEFLIGLINKLIEDGKGIIIISHAKSFTEKLNSKNLYLSNGKLTSQYSKYG